MAFPRNRSDDLSSRGTTAIYKTTYCNGTSYTQMEADFFKTGHTKTMSDFVEPNFHERKLAGEIMNHPMSSLKTEYEDGSMALNWKIVYNPTCTGTAIKTMEGNSGRNGFAVATFIDANPGLAQAISDLSALTGTKVFAGVEKPEWNAVLFAAELDKTFTMFRPSLAKFQKTLGRAQKDYYKAKRKGGSLYAKAVTGANALNGLQNWIASNWLRYRYGMLPLIYDWEDFNKVVEEKELSPRLTSRAKAKHTFDEQTDTLTYTGDVYFTHTLTRSETTTLTVRSGLLYEHDLKLLDRVGYSASNILPTAWELVPFSFVVDWLVNTGDLIEAAVPKVGVRELARWTKVTIESECSVTKTMSPKTVANRTITCYGSNTSKRRVTSVTRSPQLQVGVVSKWRYIDLSQGVHRKHLVDTLALIKTILFR